MIEYNTSKDRLFTSHTDTMDVLSGILDIKVTIKGEITCSPLTCPCDTVVIKRITVDSGISGMTVYIESALLGISGSYNFTRSGGTYVTDGIDSTIELVWDDNSVSSGTYYVDASLRLRCIDIIPMSTIGLDKGDGSRVDYTTGVNINSGYNADVYFDETSGYLNIIGGPGLGLGRYSGSTDKHTSHSYSGIRSINGIHAGRNINIKLSDVLVGHGSKVYVEK